MSLGETLASARCEAGLSVEQVSDRTRIRATVIRAMENDEFSVCGGDIYARGHLRSIAHTIGVDPVPLIALFDADHTESAPTASEVFEAESSTQRRHRGPNWSAVMAVALVAAVGLVTFQVFRADSSGHRGTATIADPATSLSDGTTGSSPAPSESQTQIAQAPPNEVLLKITTLPTAASWVQVSDHSDTVLFTGTMTQGQSKTFRDPKALKVVIGNAAGVDLVVNGTDVGSPGASGEVAHLTFTPSDPGGSAG